MTDQEYSDRVDNLIGTLGKEFALGHEIDIMMCVHGLEPGRPENRKVRDFVGKKLRIPLREFDRAMQVATIKFELGIIPRTAIDYIKAYAKVMQINVRFNGVLTTNQPPYLEREDGGRDYIPHDLWQNREFHTLIHNSFQRPIPLFEFQRALRVRAAELRLEFSSSVINDASEVWYEQQARDRLWQIMGEIEYSNSLAIRQTGQDGLKRLAERCFECAEGPEFVASIFSKVIWQVKRKIDGLPIFNHLMLVMLGNQGIGKTTLITEFIKPVAELSAEADFRLITDDRNITLWRNFILTFNEMADAKRSDLDTVKHVITADTLTRRVMRTNLTQMVSQNATLIGSANVTEIGELIRDFTGTRRFLGLMMKPQLDWDLINALDWSAVWQSVDHRAADPTIPFQNAIKQRQEAERPKSAVEEWVASIDPSSLLNGVLTRRRIRSGDLHTEFRVFEDARFPGSIKTSQNSFIREMRRLAERENTRFHYVQENGYLFWEWTGQ